MSAHENQNQLTITTPDNDPEAIKVVEGEVVVEETGVTNPRATIDEFAAWISDSWRSSMEGILETGRRLMEAKNKLPYGDYMKMIADRLPFGDSVALRLRKIAESPLFSNPAPVQDLPHSYSVLYEMIAFSQKNFDNLLNSGAINKNTTRNEIIQLKRAINNPKSKSTTTRTITQPTLYNLRLTHNEAFLLHEMFKSANDIGMTGKWLDKNFTKPAKDHPNPDTITKKFANLGLNPSLNLDEPTRRK